MGQGWGAGPVSTKLWDEWATDEPNDIRRQASIYNSALEGKDYKFGADHQMEETGMWQKKVTAITAYGKGDNPNALWNTFWSAPEYGNRTTVDDFQLGHGSDLILIRFADVLLMHSELTETNAGMNRVRARVGLPELPYSQTNLRNERRWELAFEGLRWGDIRRWGIAGDALDAIYGVAIHHYGQPTIQQPQSPGGVKQRYEATKGFYNKPQREIVLSKGTLIQNDGWGSEANFNGWVDN